MQNAAARVDHAGTHLSPCMRDRSRRLLALAHARLRLRAWNPGGQVQSGKPIHKDRQCAFEKRNDLHDTGMVAERSLADRSHILVGLETAAQLLHRVLGAPDVLCFRRRCSDLLARNTLLLVS